MRKRIRRNMTVTALVQWPDPRVATQWATVDQNVSVKNVGAGDRIVLIFEDSTTGKTHTRTVRVPGVPS